MINLHITKIIAVTQFDKIIMNLQEDEEIYNQNYSYNFYYRESSETPD